MGCHESQQPMGATSRYRLGAQTSGFPSISSVLFLILSVKLLVKRFDIFIAFADFKCAQEVISVSSYQQVFVFIFKNY